MENIEQEKVLGKENIIIGTPCKPASGAYILNPPMLAKRFNFESATFSRRVGDVLCHGKDFETPFHHNTDSICQFSAPDSVSIRTNRGLFYFDTGPGQDATVFVERGVARCVLSSPYWSAHYRANTETDALGRSWPYAYSVTKPVEARP
jgi:hypothetical protein